VSDNLIERIGKVREAGRLVDVTPFAICITCMSIVKPEVRFNEMIGHGWAHFRHEHHQLCIIRLKRRGEERWIEYSGSIPDWLKFTIEKFWKEFRAPPEEVVYKVRLLLKAYHLLQKIVRCWAERAPIRLPVPKSCEEPDWLEDFLSRIYCFELPRACREEG